MIRGITCAATLALALGAGLAGQAGARGVVIGMQLEPPVLDPTAGAAGAIDEIVYANVFEGLTRFGADGSIVPGLAESWEVSADGLSWTFRLRDGVRFHDGTAFDAEDVVFSFERAQAEDSANAQKALFAPIAAATAVDPLTVRIDLSQPTGALDFNLAWGDAVIVAPESAASNATDPVGTGPFRFARWARGDRVELTRNEDYWGEPAALDGATFKFVSDPTAAFAAVMAGDIEAFPAFPAPEMLDALAADPRFRVTIGSTEGETILAMNNARPPLDDIRMRRAITHAIDRKALIDGAMFGHATPIGSHFAPHHPDYVDLTELSQHDPDLSRRLLEETGLQGAVLSLKLPPPSYARRGGEIVAAQLREVGIETRIETLEWAQWLEQVFRGRDFDLTIVAHTEPMDIGIYARESYYFGYDDAEFRQFMDVLARETDPDQRSWLLQAAQRKIAVDAVNAFLFQLPRAMVADARLTGLWENAPTQANDLTAVRWE
ncbi:MAG: ABC transporter substrate-binding protein [Rubrimonas sp.]